MDAAQFKSDRAGRLIKVHAGTAAEFVAFDPAPVPRTLDLGPELVLALSDADQALGRLAGLGRQLPNPHILIRPYLRREAVASTRIEGTQSTLGEVLAAEAQRLPESPDVLEVLNYVRALEVGLQRLTELPLSNRLLREMHVELMRGVRGAERIPGEFRTSPNWIGGHGPSDAVFVPPPPDRLPDALSDLERYLHEDPQLPALVRSALIHYQFETIHPFLDGNGRLGRLLIVFYLVERGILDQPLLYLSAYLERHRREYVERLQAVRETGDYEGWITFFLRAAATQAGAAIRSAERLLALADDFRARLRQIRARGQAVEAAESLIGNPYVSAPRLAEALGLTRQGGQYVVSTLERAGIVALARGDTRPTLYVARDVLAVLEDDEE
jgi:cell filamentation protein, protein adenylyltransferase